MNLGAALLLAIVAAASFAPALAALAWLRWEERGRKDDWLDLAEAFAFGALASSVAALVLELLAASFIDDVLRREYGLFSADPSTVTLVAVFAVAPLVEEAAKALGAIRSSGRIWRPRNGLIIGAACGLGFAATENLFFESAAMFGDGYEAFISLALVRSVSSMLMHASTASLTGYGIARGRVYGRPWWPFYLLAVAMHSAFNILASLGDIASPQFGAASSLVGLMAAIAMTLAAVFFIRRRLRGYYA